MKILFLLLLSSELIRADILFLDPVSETSLDNLQRKLRLSNDSTLEELVSLLKQRESFDKLADAMRSKKSRFSSTKRRISSMRRRRSTPHQDSLFDLMDSNLNRIVNDQKSKNVLRNQNNFDVRDDAREISEPQLQVYEKRKKNPVHFLNTQLSLLKKGKKSLRFDSENQHTSLQDSDHLSKEKNSKEVSDPQVPIFNHRGRNQSKKTYKSIIPASKSEIKRLIANSKNKKRVDENLNFLNDILGSINEDPMASPLSIKKSAPESDNDDLTSLFGFPSSSPLSKQKSTFHHRRRRHRISKVQNKKTKISTDSKTTNAEHIQIHKIEHHIDDTIVHKTHHTDSPKPVENSLKKPIVVEIEAQIQNPGVSSGRPLKIRKRAKLNLTPGTKGTKINLEISQKRNSVKKNSDTNFNRIENGKIKLSPKTKQIIDYYFYLLRKEKELSRAKSFNRARDFDEFSSSPSPLTLQPIQGIEIQKPYLGYPPIDKFSSQNFEFGSDSYNIEPSLSSNSPFGFFDGETPQISNRLYTPIRIEPLKISSPSNDLFDTNSVPYSDHQESTFEPEQKVIPAKVEKNRKVDEILEKKKDESTDSFWTRAGEYHGINPFRPFFLSVNMYQDTKRNFLKV